MMIPVSLLIEDFQWMYRQHWAYEWGKAETGCVDCSGAFVYAYRKYKNTIAHGSNSIARKHCGALRPISEAQPGWAAFKLHRPGEKDYNLPKKFAGHPDQNDYYHIGLVDLDGKHVLNAQSVKAGFTRTKLSAWGMVAPLNAVIYPNNPSAKERETMETMTIVAENGGTVNVRREPRTSSEKLASLKVGTQVQAEPEKDGWRKITYSGGKTGYMMAEFLEPAQVTPAPTVATATDLQVPAGQFVTLTLTQGDLEKLLQARDLMISVLGVG